MWKASCETRWPLWRALLTTLLASCGLAVVVAIPGQAGGDTESPHLVSFSFEPASVNTALSEQHITFTVHLTDDLSGAQGGPGTPTQVRFESPSGNQGFTAVFDADLYLVSGTILDGIYVHTEAVPRYSETGVWRLDYFLLNDEVGNITRLYYDDVAARGFPVEFVVVDDVRRVLLPVVAIVRDVREPLR